MQRMSWVRALAWFLLAIIITFSSLWIDAHLNHNPLPVKKKVAHRLKVVTKAKIVSFVPNFTNKAQYRWIEPISLQRIEWSLLFPDDDHPRDAAQPLIDTVLVVPKWFANPALY